MKTQFGFRLLAALSGIALSAAAAPGETTLMLVPSIGFRGAGPSQVTVPPGEYLTILASSREPVQWAKDGRMIPGTTSNSLVILAVSRADAGIYHAIYFSPVLTETRSQSLILNVASTQRLVNLSTRAQVGAGEKTFIAGFVVTGSESKKIIVRAIGPSLAQFQISEPVARPAIAIFDGGGKPYTSGYFYPLCAGCPTYESDLAESLVKAGAFPVPAGSNDVVEMRPFIPGAYTVHVTSADGTPGIVLLEIYEVP